MFEFLAIDWGSVRIGMAFGSSFGLVLPFGENLDWGNFWQILKNQIETRKTQKIIVGIPTNFEFGKTETGTKIELFITELEQKLKSWDEMENHPKQGETKKRETKKKFFSKIEIIIINERNSTKNTQNINLPTIPTTGKFPQNYNKKSFQQKMAFQQKFQQQFKPTKTQTNHLAAVEILTKWLENQ
jgi:RNase H-fold protein (predicted Holliday junction resolvase)